MIRLISDIPIVLDCTQKEIPSLVSQYVKNSEQNSAIGTEFRRELIRNKVPLTKDNLIKMACRVDRLIKPSPKESTVRIAMAQEQHCSVCHEEHDHRREDGRLWPACEHCFYAFDKQTRPKSRTYNPPRIPASVPDVSKHGCVDCNVHTNINPRSNRPFLRCKDCFSKYKPRFLTGEARDARPGRNRPFGRSRGATGFNDYRNQRYNNQRFPKSVNLFKSRAWFNPKCYRMAAKVQNSAKTAAITALVDTGCNTEVISKDACRELGIAQEIQPRNSYATVVDGNKLNIIGAVSTKVWIGDVEYEGTFSVIDRMAGYDMMVGTSFMKKVGLLDDIFNVAANRLGATNVRKGN